MTCGKNSIRTYRLRKGQLRGCSVNLGDLKLSKMVTNAPPGTQDFQLNDFTTLAFEIGYGITELDQKHVYVATVTGAVVQVNYGKRCLECVYQLHDGAINALCINEVGGERGRVRGKIPGKSLEKVGGKFGDVVCG